MKKVSKFFMLFMFIPLALGLCACGGGKNDRLISVSIYNSSLATTKTTYFCGEEMLKSQTFVALKYYDKEENTEYTLNTYLSGLSKKGFAYEVSGFDSSVPVNDQEVTITITSEKYEGEVSTTLYVDILPAYVAEIEVVDAETYLKDVYVVNETLPIEEMQIKKIYNDGHEETVALSNEMISGFDTSNVNPNSSKMTITCDGKTFDAYYTVAPAENFDLFSEAYLKCFLPNGELGYKVTTDTMFNDAEKWKKDNVGSIEIGCYQAMADQTESMIINRYSTTGNIARPNVTILSFEKTKINGIDATIAKFRIGSSATVYTDIYITRSVKFTNGSVSSTGMRTIKILFENFGGNEEATGMIENVINSIR